jgi:hypothetical protein
MKIGIAGAHRVGKTSLAEKIVERLPFLHFGRTNVSNADVWKNYGINPDGEFTFAERLVIQDKLFAHVQEIVNNTPDGSVFDRTYLDLLGYLYSNIDNTCSSLYDDQVMDFTIRCMNAMFKDFGKIIIVPPAIEVQSADNKNGKVFMSKGYIESINNHVIAYAARSRIPYIIIPYEMVDLHERAAYCVNFIETA